MANPDWDELIEKAEAKQAKQRAAKKTWLPGILHLVSGRMILYFLAFCFVFGIFIWIVQIFVRFFGNYFGAADDLVK